MAAGNSGLTLSAIQLISSSNNKLGIAICLPYLFLSTPLAMNIEEGRGASAWIASIYAQHYDCWLLIHNILIACVGPDIGVNAKSTCAVLGNTHNSIPANISFMAHINARLVAAVQ